MGAPQTFKRDTQTFTLSGSGPGAGWDPGSPSAAPLTARRAPPTASASAAAATAAAAAARLLLGCWWWWCCGCGYGCGGCGCGCGGSGGCGGGSGGCGGGGALLPLTCPAQPANARGRRKELPEQAAAGSGSPPGSYRLAAVLPFRSPPPLLPLPLPPP